MKLAERLSRRSTARLGVLALVLGAVLLSGCEGDARDLTEPVEAKRLNLASLRIVPPTGTITPLYINPETKIAFRLEATNTANQKFDINSANRRWAVSDDSVATINDDGYLTGVQTGMVEVRVLIGEIWAPVFNVNVSFGTLSAISEIAGAEALQPCVAQTYSAKGSYTDGSTRGLPAVRWRVLPQENASFIDGEISGSIDLSATIPGELMLTATVDNISADKTLSVDNSLQSIRLAENLSVPADGTLQLIAQGGYMGAENIELKNITAQAAWSITQGEDQASIGNTSTNKGLLSGISTGSVMVQAACGDVTAETTVLVTESVTQLTTDEGTSFTLLLNGPVQQLRVFESGIEVTELATWGPVGSDTGVARVSNAEGTRGEVTPVTQGDTIIRATYNNATIDFDILVR